MKKGMAAVYKKMGVMSVLYIFIQSYYQVKIYTGIYHYCTIQDNPVVQQNMTLITAYFDLGSFRKGYYKTFEKETYFHWLKAYKYISNPIIVYTDSDTFVSLFKDIRRDMLQKTKVIMLQRKNMWSFKITSKIKRIFLQPNYPHFHPNTVYPEYSSVQHAKYELVSMGIRSGLFHSHFYAWIDLGYFRDIIDSKKLSVILPPSDIDNTKIAVNQIFDFNRSLTVSEIFKGNHIWVGGGLFIGTQYTLNSFEHIYKHAVNHFLDLKLMNTDQQVLYALYSDYGQSVFRPSIKLQVYKPNNYTDDPWFFLGYHCRVEITCR